MLLNIFKTKKTTTYIRLLLSIAIVVLVLKKLDLYSIVILLTSLNLHYLYLAFFITVSARLLMTYRWSFLLETQSYIISKFKLLKIMLLSHAIGTLFPSTLSSDGIRAYVLWKHTGNANDSVSSIGVDRFAGLFALTGIAFVSSLLLFRTQKDYTFVVISGALFSLCIFITIGVFWLNIRVAQLCQRLERLFSPKWSLKVAKILEAFLHFAKHKRTLAYVLCLSALVQLLRILMIFYLAQALRIQIAFLHFSLFLPIIMVLLMLPISIGGIGVREAAFIYFFGPLGMSGEEAVGLSLLIYMLVTWWILIGLIIYAKEGTGLRKRTVGEKS
jgi:uncharacterized protein (TIRG00374 family)